MATPTVDLDNKHESTLMSVSDLFSDEMLTKVTEYANQKAVTDFTLPEEVDGKTVTSKKSADTGTDERSTILDRDWAKNAFLLSDVDLNNDEYIANRYWSSASTKFVDTRLGCNIGINPRPQFTRYADIRSKGRIGDRSDVTLNNASGNYGLGRYYSESLDDNSQVVYLRFGVPQFNSLLNFLSRAFDPVQSTISRTGRGTSAWYKIGQFVGSVAGIVAFPAIALFVIGVKAVNSLFTRPTSKFYTLKPTMHTYWSTVNTLVNTLAINKGIFPKVMADENNKQQRVGQPFSLDQGYLNDLSKLMPDVFREAGYFDIYALANKAQRMANNLFVSDYENISNETATDFTGYVRKQYSGQVDHKTWLTNNNAEPTLASRINKISMFGSYQTENKNLDSSKAEMNPAVDTTGTQVGKDPSNRDYVNNDKSWSEEYWQCFDAEFRDGAQFAVFRVDHTGSVSESFGNSTIESDLSQKLNSKSSEMREARFSFSEGNLLGGTGVGDVVGGVLNGAKDLISGTLSGITFGFSNVLMALTGSGYIDIPKHWQSSSASLPRSSYTIQLISPYGNPISQMINIYIPLCMLLAGSLPLSTGKASYTSPFICQLFDRGRCQVRLGMIESLSINRGVCNLPFDIKGAPMAIDVSFTIADLSSVMHMPVSNGDLFNSGEITDIVSGSAFNADMTLDEDNILMDYLAVLAGQDMYTQIYPFGKAKLALAKKIVKKAKLSSPAYWAAMTHDTAVDGMLKYLGVGPILEGVVRGTSIVNKNAADIT